MHAPTGTVRVALLGAILAILLPGREACPEQEDPSSHLSLSVSIAKRELIVAEPVMARQVSPTSIADRDRGRGRFGQRSAIITSGQDALYSHSGN